MSVELRPDIPLPVAEDASAPRPRLRRLRLAAILFALLLLGLVSFVFGIVISVASDLPSLEVVSQYKNAESTHLLDDLGRPLGILSQQNRVIVTPQQIPQIAKEAVISIEDKRFETNSGVDIRSIARAFFQDILHKGAVQGASTIEQQFIKNALQAQSHRTIFEKLREAALAYQLAHKWSKEKILTAYLNTIYFGNGAYGIESAAETYFGHDVNHLGCGSPGHALCVEQLQPWEAALLAGIIQSPTRFDPATDPTAARERRDTVLAQMLAQGYITRPIYDESIRQALPAPHEIQAAHEQTVEGVDAGYFTSWIDQQVIERYGAYRAFDGGLQVRTTLDLDLQRAAEQAVNNYLAYPGGPTASLVAIENSTGEVRAMVGGRNYDSTPFNIATEGERQPGSSFKAFDLAAALEDGISPYSVWTSKQKEFIVPNTHGQEHFIVHNDEGAYSGSNTLTGATAFSDNSIYAEVGLRVGTHRIARLAHRMGITTPLSTNPAMTIGGLTVGVTPLDMAHAYETIAHGGERVSGTLASAAAPVGIQEVSSPNRPLPDGSHRDVNSVRTMRVLPAPIASTETSMLETVLQYGTGRAAAIGQFAAGKTGTTSNYGDAWFVGWDSKYTVAVWVGYPDKLVPMTTDFNGTPVLGGTFPALIWHDFMTAALGIDKTRAEANPKSGSNGTSTTSTSSGEGGESGGGGAQTGTASTPTSATSPPASHGSSPATPAGGGQAEGTGGGEHATTPAAPTPESQTATPSPAAPSTPSSPSTGGASPTGGVSPSG
ncbi:MAG TPA: transglycosylase domain-containing protein [Solirubrobacteraceae bacterium]|jgi:penicillin-binding protein 1A|nr:transglycosylase domain-containing protein [Solirubrobacteraceae bacterium]